MVVDDVKPGRLEVKAQLPPAQDANAVATPSLPRAPSWSDWPISKATLPSELQVLCTLASLLPAGKSSRGGGSKVAHQLPFEQPPPATEPPYAAVGLAEALPDDVLLTCLRHCGARTLVSVACTCSTLRRAADSDELWLALFARRFGCIVAEVPLGTSAAPAGGQRAKDFYFAFGATWMRAAMHTSGRVLLRLEQRVVDVTDFVDDHPGDPELLTGSAGCDVAEAFEYVEHSVHARRMLERLRRPELELPYEGSLCSHRPNWAPVDAVRVGSGGRVSSWARALSSLMHESAAWRHNRLMSMTWGC